VVDSFNGTKKNRAAGYNKNNNRKRHPTTWIGNQYEKRSRG